MAGDDEGSDRDDEKQKRFEESPTLNDEKSSTSAVIRQDQVDTAVRFMMGPKVRSTPIEDQKEFLRKKGLTAAEIQVAVDRVEAQLGSGGVSHRELTLYNDDVSAGHQRVMMMPQQQSSWITYANSIMILGGFSYALYYFSRKIILPRLFGVPDPDEQMRQQIDHQLNELHNSVRFMMDTVQQTLQAVQSQQDSLNRALTLLGQNMSSGTNNDQMQRQVNELRNDMAVVKGLLLSRNQFAPVPAIPNFSSPPVSAAANFGNRPATSPQLPAWQQQNGTRSGSGSSTVTSYTSASGPLGDGALNGTANGNGHHHRNDSSISDDDVLSEDDNNTFVNHNGNHTVGLEKGEEDRKLSTPV